MLYGDQPELLEQLQRQDSTAGGLYPTLDGTGGQRLLVVANRLPVSAYKDRAGKWQLQVSAGGLVSALMGVGNFQTKWIGWPGVYIEASPERDELTAALHGEGYAPVYLDQKTCDLHYNGFCNSVLWQLFHYVPLNIDSKLSETRTLQFQWAAHQLANRLFAEVVLQHYQDGDIVWVQDYHLMLLPAILKEHRPRMKVGFFLHTPFPSSEIYRTLPVREELLRSVLRADLIGFHTYDYARHFVSACTRILGLEGTPAGVEDNGSLTRVAAFPIGIDPDRFTTALEAPEVRANVAQLLNRYAGRKVMLGVDRLDMIKGIPQKLLAFEKFLEEHPEWRDKVLLVQIAVPSRTDVPEYQRLRSMVHEVVGRINGQYGTLTHVPIYHLDRQLSFDELVALYAITDVALVTSLRDGMNLVSYEYVACQRDNAGVLILSEFAGAAQSLGAGAILVNPWNINDLAQAIEYALTMSDAERRERHRQNYMHVTIHTAQTWADTFISELNDTHVEAELRTRNIPPHVSARAPAAPPPPRPGPSPHSPPRPAPRPRSPLAARPAVRGGRLPRRPQAPAGAGLQRDADHRGGGPPPAQEALRPDPGPHAHQPRRLLVPGRPVARPHRAGGGVQRQREGAAGRRVRRPPRVAGGGERRVRARAALPAVGHRHRVRHGGVEGQRAAGVRVLLRAHAAVVRGAARHLAGVELQVRRRRVWAHPGARPAAAPAHGAHQ